MFLADANSTENSEEPPEQDLITILFALPRQISVLNRLGKRNREPARP